MRTKILMPSIPPKVGRMKRSMAQKREERNFYLSISPWLVGLFCLMLGPMLVSLYTSFCVWDAIDPPKFVGLDNFMLMLQDEQLLSSIGITLKYVLLGVPSSLLFALLLAILLNKNIPGSGFFQAMFYFPATVSGVAVFMAWTYLFDPVTGLFNYLLSVVGIQGPTWLASTDWALPALLIMNLFFCGGQMLIFVAGLKQIPRAYYEAAQIDGANAFQMFWHITLPQLSLVFVFNLVIGLINGVQVFSQAFVMTGGGPARSTYFFVYYLYQTAFKFQDFGYASAMSWGMFLVIMILSCIVMMLNKKRQEG